MMPGITNISDASMTSMLSSGFRPLPIAAILPLRTKMSVLALVPSVTVSTVALRTNTLPSVRLRETVGLDLRRLLDRPRGFRLVLRFGFGVRLLRFVGL